MGDLVIFSVCAPIDCAIVRGTRIDSLRAAITIQFTAVVDVGCRWWPESDPSLDDVMRDSTQECRHKCVFCVRVPLTALVWAMNKTHTHMSTWARFGDYKYIYVDVYGMGTHARLWIYVYASLMSTHHASVTPVCCNLTHHSEKGLSIYTYAIPGL